jgi:hypothetical protein
MTTKTFESGPDGMAMRWFRAIGILGLILSVAAFALYVAGIIPTDVTPEASAEQWSAPAGEDRGTADLASGSGWMFASTDAYAASTAALAILASTALPVLAVLAVAWFRRRDFLYGFMALFTAAILAAAILS